MPTRRPPTLTAAQVAIIYAKAEEPTSPPPLSMLVVDIAFAGLAGLILAGSALFGFLIAIGAIK